MLRGFDQAVENIRLKPHFQSQGELLEAIEPATKAVEQGLFKGASQGGAFFWFDARRDALSIHALRSA